MVGWEKHHNLPEYQNSLAEKDAEIERIDEMIANLEDAKREAIEAHHRRIRSIPTDTIDTLEAEKRSEQKVLEDAGWELFPKVYEDFDRWLYTNGYVEYNWDSGAAKMQFTEKGLAAVKKLEVSQ